jgi:PAS domain
VIQTPTACVSHAGSRGVPTITELNQQLAGIEPVPLQELYRHWATLPDAVLVPKINHFRPRALGEDIIGHVAVTEIERQPLRIRYRYVGRSLIELYGEDLTGRYVNDLFSESVRRKAIQSYNQVLETRRPLYSKRVFNLWFKKLGYYRLMLPFTMTTDAIAYVVVAIYPMQSYLKRAEQWRSMPEAEEFFSALGNGSEGSGAV